VLVGVDWLHANRKVLIRTNPVNRTREKGIFINSTPHVWQECCIQALAGILLQARLVFSCIIVLSVIGG
jgi:hypothetical protein